MGAHMNALGVDLTHFDHIASVLSKDAFGGVCFSSEDVVHLVVVGELLYRPRSSGTAVRGAFFVFKLSLRCSSPLLHPWYGSFFPSGVASLNDPISPTLVIYCRWRSRSLGSHLQLHVRELPWSARTRHRVLDTRILQVSFTALHQQGVAVPG